MYTTGQKIYWKQCSFYGNKKMKSWWKWKLCSKEESKIFKENQEPIAGQPKLFPDPMSMFDWLPFKDSIVEKTLVHIKAREDADSDTYVYQTFCHRQFMEIAKQLYVGKNFL